MIYDQYNWKEMFIEDLHISLLNANLTSKSLNWKVNCGFWVIIWVWNYYFYILIEDLQITLKIWNSF